MEIITTNGRIMKDGVSSAKYIGFANGKNIVVYNCHLTSHPSMGYNVPCLFGTIEEEKQGFYYYRKAYIIYMGRGLRKIIIR